jgi:uncharacterized protein
MTRIFAVAVLFCTSLTLNSFAQDNVKETHIRQLMNMMGSGQLGVQVLKNIIASYKKSMPDVDPQFWDDFVKQVKPEDLINLVVPIYAKYFTDDDIKSMMTFYNSPVGQKLIANLPLITQESMQVGGAWGKQLSEKIMQSLKDKGYLKNS